MAASSAAAPLLDAALTHEKVSSTAEQMASTKDNSQINDSPSNEIRIVQPRDYKAAAACLAEAFAHDPVVRYSIDTPDRMHLSEDARFALHTQSLEYLTYAHCLNGLVLALGGEGGYDCVALWLPPGKNIDDYWTILRSGMWRLTFTLSKEGKERFFNEFLPLLGRSKREVLGPRDAESWYLNYIGTRVGGRGKGYARRLVEYVTKQADKEGRACYLESSHDVNLLIYGKMGFVLKKQIWLRRDVVERRMDVMVREPQGVQEAEENGVQK